LGGILAEPVRVFRFKRSVRLLEKVKHIAEESGIELKAVPTKTLLPILENASVEDDEGLHDRWAALLANAASPTSPRVPPSFVEILRQLSPRDACLLWRTSQHLAAMPEDPQAPFSFKLTFSLPQSLSEETVFEVWNDLGYSESGSRPLATAERDSPFGKQRERDFRDFRVSFGNLLRLGLLEKATTLSIPTPSMEDVSNATQGPGGVMLYDEVSEYHMTELGHAFVEACTKPTEKL
jgi:hypothetical protein